MGHPATQQIVTDVNPRLRRIAAQIAGSSDTPSYGDDLDSFIQRLSDSGRLLEDIQKRTSSPEGKVIVTGIHSDLFNMISEFRGWIDRLKSMFAAPPKGTSS